MGIILQNLYVEGAFDTTLESLGILVAGFNDYRKLRKEDKEAFENDEDSSDADVTNDKKEE